MAGLLNGRRLAGLERAAAAATDNAVALGFVSGWRLVRLLPESTAQALFARVADEMHRRDGRSVQRLRANLTRVRPGLTADELDRLTRDALRSYLRYWCESFRLPSWPLDDLVRRTRIVNEPIIREAYGRGRGVVVPLPHMGNWDWAGTWACASVAPLMTVAERLKPERLYDEFVAYRSSLGMKILPLTGGDASFPQLVDWVSDGGLVCLLADRDLSRTSVEVKLCGVPARMPRGPAVLARKTGAPLVPVTLNYLGDEMELRFHDEIPHADGDAGLVTMMQGVADAFTSTLREHPQDWHMLQRVFTDDGPQHLARGAQPPAGG